MSRIAETLRTKLEATFAESVRTGDTDRLTQCLRTFAFIDRTADAEALYRTLVVAPFVAKVGRARCICM
jgi:hypothetical protein